MGRTTSFKKNFNNLGFRSPSWRIRNYFARLAGKAKLSRFYEKHKLQNQPPMPQDPSDNNTKYP